MRKKVAIEKNLVNVQQYFKGHGYQVDMFDDTQLHRIEKVGDYDAIIVSGGNIDFLGIQDTSTEVPVVSAEGLSAEQIYSTVQNRRK
ncbi:YkuS family protein [Fonticella tunisiensis]|uniref:Uncharacterized protein UPF0180 n=1 Tax=Fonticella tunisiensis TaxID=1096341 RepID=A0A4R7K7I5_9CLOT|nr:YkuS family protein [Fonticella tunisiensis]TDT45659.1 uncharacterized protein UPF0180 [Fonticella tunisiensis]